MNISDKDKLWITSKIYASINSYFAHWDDIQEHDFDSIYHDYLESISTTNDRYTFTKQTLYLFNQLNNPHTGFVDKALFNIPNFGFEIAYIEEKWVVVQSSIKEVDIGDSIVKIEGVDIESFFQANKHYIPAIQEIKKRTLLPLASPFLLDNANTVEFIFDNGIHYHYDADRKFDDEQTNSSTVTTKMMDKDTLYLGISSFEQPKFEQAAVEQITQHMEVKNLILDLRNNVGGTTPLELIKRLINKPFVTLQHLSPLHVAAFGARKSIADYFPEDKFNDYVRGLVNSVAGLYPLNVIIPGEKFLPEGETYQGDIVVLINHGTASAAEDFLYSLVQTKRATLVGEQTYGSTGEPYFYEFANDMAFFIGSKRAYTQDMQLFEGHGFLPDYEVKTTVNSIVNGIDIQLERAMELLNTSKT